MVGQGDGVRPLAVPALAGRDGDAEQRHDSRVGVGAEAERLLSACLAALVQAPLAVRPVADLVAEVLGGQAGRVGELAPGRARPQRGDWPTFTFMTCDTGNNLAATAGGATLRELMDRMGHTTARAALIYLHGSDARQHEIADTLSKLVRAEMKRTGKPATGEASGKPSGTQRARRGNKPLEDQQCTSDKHCPTWAGDRERSWRPEQDSNLRPTA